MKNLFCTLILATSLAGTIAFAPCASAATYTFVGSWQVYDPSAPYWAGTPPNGPLAYTAQEAAALLFGGSPSSYVISTVDNNPANINFQAWYDVIGFGGGIFSQSYFNKYLGLYYGPTVGYAFGNSGNPASAFVQDNFVNNTNFAFTVSEVPLPAALPLLATAVAGLGAASRRRKRAAAS